MTARAPNLPPLQRAPHELRASPRPPARRALWRALLALPAIVLASGVSARAAVASDPASVEPPPAYREMLADPRIAEALVWDGAWSDAGGPDGTGPRAYPRWDAVHRAALHRRLAALEGGGAEAAPIDPVEPVRLEAGRWLPAEAAWQVFVAHAAHALAIESHRDVAWSLRSLTPEQVGLLLDGRNLLERDPDRGHGYVFGPSGAIAAWAPEPVFTFVRDHDLLAASQEETVFAIADWVRRSVRPVAADALEPPGSGGVLSVDAVLAAAAAGGPSIPGCDALSGLLAGAFRSVNIPVRVTASPFAHPGREAAPHSRVELPTLGRGLAHSSELHALLALPSGNAIPTAALFPTLGWIRDHVEHPRHLDCAEGSCHTEAEQALFNSVQRLVALAAIHLPDGLLIDRAEDASAADTPARLLDTLTSGCAGRSGRAFVRPLFEDAERREIARRADEAIERAGGGDWKRGAETVRKRWQRLLENR